MGRRPRRMEHLSVKRGHLPSSHFHKFQGDATYKVPQWSLVGTHVLRTVVNENIKESTFHVELTLKTV